MHTEELLRKQQILDDAKPGELVRIGLRGPAEEDEIEELRKEYEAAYAGVRFEFTSNNAESSVDLVESIPELPGGSE
jgi:hypothetical protein